MILKFRKRNNLFRITQNNKEKEYDKNDITKIICYYSNAENAPWASFEYAEVNLKSGEKLYLTSLLIAKDKLEDHILNVEYEFRKRWIQKIVY